MFSSNYDQNIFLCVPLSQDTLGISGTCLIDSKGLEWHLRISLALEPGPYLGGSQHSITQFALVGLDSSKILIQDPRTVRFTHQCKDQHSIQVQFTVIQAQIPIQAYQISVEINLV